LIIWINGKYENCGDMGSQEIKLGRPSIINSGEIRLGRMAPAAAPDRGPARPPAGDGGLNRTSTVAGNKSEGPPADKQVNKRGYSIGVNAAQETEQAAGAQRKNQPTVRPITLIMFCGAVIFLVVVLLIAPEDPSGLQTGGSAFMNSYAAYLAKRKESPGIDPKQRLADVDYRLHRAALAEGTGDYQKARAELYELMLLDRDAQSPLYKECSVRLQRLPE
jgi:hypothetical protein